MKSRERRGNSQRERWPSVEVEILVGQGGDSGEGFIFLCILNIQEDIGG